MMIGLKELAMLIGAIYDAPMIPVDATQLACLSRNIYHEARSEARDGMVAVGYVTTHRLDMGKWGDTLCSVVESPKQFSWFSDGKPDTPRDLDAYAMALDAAVDVLLKRVPDPTRRASYYFAHDLVLPVWAASMVTTKVIGGHTFKTTCPSHSAAPECWNGPPPKNRTR